MRFHLIGDHRDIWSVRVICDALSVSPSGFYAWRSRPESPRKIANRELLANIRRVHAQHRERYGIHAELRAEGHAINRMRVARIMRQHGIRARMRPITWRSTSVTSVPSGVLPGRRMTATGLPVVAS